jgi:hypothetical protein
MASLDKVLEKAIEDGSILGAVLLARDSSGTSLGLVVAPNFADGCR